jgi:hypothetical protein
MAITLRPEVKKRLEIAILDICPYVDFHKANIHNAAGKTGVCFGTIHKLRHSKERLRRRCVRVAEKINYPILLVSSAVFFVARCYEYFNMHGNARLEYSRIFYAI